MFFNQLKEREAETPPMWQQLLNLTQKISWLTAGARPAPAPPPDRATSAPSAVSLRERTRAARVQR